MERVVFSRKISSRADREILRLHHNIQLHDKLAALQNEKNELQDSLNALQDSLNVLHNEKNVLSNELATVTDIKNALQAERDLLRSTLDGVYASRSWWLTKPLRAAARLARRLRHSETTKKLSQSPDTVESLLPTTEALVTEQISNLPQLPETVKPLHLTAPERPEPKSTLESKNLVAPLQRKDTPDIWLDSRPPFVTPERILALIREPAIKIVSFNIVDTLLVRPALKPKDILHLLAQKVNALYNVDFLKLRWNAEEELELQNTTLQQIYDGIAKRHKLDAATAQALMEEEICCESTLISLRPDAEMLYKEAVRLGKRVIAVSDIYLPGLVLTDILQAKGCPVDAIYVSCDYMASKNDGSLYDIMLAAEGIAPASILHVGSNYKSDYVQATNKYICAVWLPSIKELCFPNADVRDALCSKALNRGPLWSIYLGHSLNRLYGRMHNAPAHIGELQEMCHFGKLVLGPIVTALGIGEATGYPSSFRTSLYSSLDGWLPHKAYATVNRYLANSLASQKPIDKIRDGVPPVSRQDGNESSTTTADTMMSDATAVADEICRNALEVLFAPSENSSSSKAQQADITALHNISLDYTESFCITLGEYASYVGQCDVEAGMDVFYALLSNTFYNNMELFSNILLPASNSTNSATSLAKAIEYKQPFSTVFSHTGFDNPHNIYVPHIQLRGDLKIGIHIHLYYTDLPYEIIRYLQDFPTPFDLYVTITDTVFASTAQQLFCNALLPNVQNVRIITVPNRGRDVAPWVLNMRPYQANYDLFCHVHTKKSEHTAFGNAWRTYLFDNLLLADNAREIISFFEQNAALGCLFPAIPPQLRQALTGMEMLLYGSEKEYNLICSMLRRMNFEGELRRASIFFPSGTMCWYRPKALYQLFTCNLRLEEFAEEPIGTGGTLAHAMERLPALIAARNGYMVRSFTPVDAV